MKRICVFCGSNRGGRAGYATATRELASALVGAGLSVVYGGGRVGLMGELANEVLRLGGEVTGVIPRSLVEREVGHTGLSDLRVVETMHERKALMADLADGFLALPGGLGTLEEIFEVWTWAQLGMHHKPVAFLDMGGYYAPLVEFLDQATREGFVRRQHRAIAIIDDDPVALIAKMRAYSPPSVEKWIDRDET